MKKRTLIFTVLVFLSHAGLVAVGASQTVRAQEGTEKEAYSQARDSLEAANEMNASISALANQINVFGRMQLLSTHVENDLEGSNDEDGFSFRRARLGIDGYFMDDVFYKIEVDVRRDANLEEAFLQYEKYDVATISAGQIKVPFSAEQRTSSRKLDTIERNRFIRAQKLDDKELGVKLEGKIFDERVEYGVAVVNGNGPDLRRNDNDSFAYVGRVQVQPLRNRPLLANEATLHLGINVLRSKDSGGRANTLFDTEGALGSTPSGHRTLFGYDLSLGYGRFGVKGEYYHGSFEPESPADMRAIDVEGWYSQIGYFFVPEKLQAIVRHESYDPDTAMEEGNDIAWTTVGLNYFIRGHALRIQVNYIFKDERTFDIDNHTFLVELQVTF